MYLLADKYRNLTAPKGFTNLPDDAPKNASLSKVFLLYCYFDQKQKRSPTPQEMAAKLNLTVKHVYSLVQQLLKAGYLIETVRVDQVGNKKLKIPSQLRWQIFERDGYRCCKCGSKIDLTVDHIEAESRGGALTKDNLQTLCRKCNSRKGNR